jgi:hypothetical protein
MKKQLCKVLLLSATGSVLLTGCLSTHRTVVAEPRREREIVIVHEAPPPPRRDVIGHAPDKSHIWVEGYWIHTGRKWVWVPGHWELRPRASAVWVPGHWDKNDDGRGWVWTPGRWE